MFLSEKLEKKIEFGGYPLSLETGYLAGLANGSVLVKYGDTTLLVAAVIQESTENKGFLPLRVDYEERLYAGGRIKGSRFIKREGRPSDEATLKARAVDRSIRPLFPHNFYHEVQIVVTVLSVDPEVDDLLPAILGASVALQLAGAPVKRPIAAVRVGLLDNEFILNPSFSQIDESSLDLVLSLSREEIVMIEVGAKEVAEEKVAQAMHFAREQSGPLLDFMEEFCHLSGAKEREFALAEIDDDLEQRIFDFVQENMPQEILSPNGNERKEATQDFLEILFVQFEGKCSKMDMEKILDKTAKKLMRKRIIETHQRVGERGLDEVRQISAEVGILPRVHGSALFRRGNTQVLSVVTLASDSYKQLLESMYGETDKKYMHHYNFPSYSTGEVGRMGSPGRREIGHGALAEKAIMPILPDSDIFPYAVRVVSEVLSSAGSTSQASACASCLALMDAGVPVSSMVSGIAMGLIKEEGQEPIILTDIAGIEDFYGDMDFKVAGTEKGVTAIQLDVKVLGVTVDLLEQAMYRARDGRLKIMQVMKEAIQSPRDHLSEYAPQIVSIQIDPGTIGKVIGSGGSMIREIQETTETEINIEDDGTVTISGMGSEMIEKAKKIILDLDRHVELGEVFEGKVKQIVPFGAFIELLPDQDGLLHISEVADGFVKDVHDFLKEGDVVKVKVSEIDDRGRISLKRE